MTPDDIQNTLNEYLADGTLTLPDNALGAEIQALFDAFLVSPTPPASPPVGPPLVINNVSPIVNDGTNVTVTGTGGNLPFTDLNINAVFSVDPDDTTEARLQLTATALSGSGWTFADSFPALQSTFFPTLVADGDQNFYFNSFDTGATPQGLSFDGALELTGNMQLLTKLLSGRSSLQLQGTIGVINQVPQMQLTAPLGDAVKMGYFEVPVGFNLNCRAVSPQPGMGDTYAYPEMQLTADIIFRTQGTAIHLPVSASFFNSKSLILFGLDLNNVVSAAFSEIGSLLNGTSLSGVLPTGWSVPDIINLTNLEFVVNPSTLSLLSASIGMQTAQPWTAIPNVLTLDSIGLEFTLLDPLGSANLELSMFALADIGGGSVQFSAAYPSFNFGGEQVGDTNIDLKVIAEQFIGHSIPDAPNIKVTELSFMAQPTTGIYSGGAMVESDWTLSLGSTSLAVQTAYFSIDHPEANQTTALIGGTLAFGSGDNIFTLQVAWHLPGDIQLTGILPTINLNTLISTLSAQSFPFASSFSSINLINSIVYVEKSAGNFYFALGTQINSDGVDWGDFEIEFLNTPGGTGFAFGFVLPTEWSLADLSPSFDLLSWLKFEELSLIVATIDDPTFSFRSITAPSSPPLSLPPGAGSDLPPGAPSNISTLSFPSTLPSAPAGIKKGMSFYAKLLLDGGPLTTVSDLLGGNVATLQLQANIPADYRDANFIANFAGPYNIIGQYVVLNNLALTIEPMHEYISLYLSVTFNIFGSSLRLGGGVLLEGTEVTFVLQTEQAWVNPFGIQGLTINKMGIGFTVGTVVALSLAGKITIGTGSSQVSVDAGVEFNAELEGAPDALLGEESGIVNLGDIITTFTSISVPAELVDIQLQGFNLVIVANPNGWTNPADNKHYEMGLAFSSTMRFYGLTASFAIQVYYSSGIYAKGTIDKPLVIGHIVTLANATNPAIGPYVEINTAASPYLQFSAALTLFEMARVAVDAVIQNDGFSFDFKFSISKLGEVHFTAFLKNRNEFAIDATCYFAVNNIGPIKTPFGNLGTLKVNIFLDAHFNIQIGPGDSFFLSIGATFNLQSLQLTLQDITINQSISKLADLFKVYFDTLVDQLWDLGARLFQDAESLFAYVNQGAMMLLDDISSILKNGLHVAADRAAQLLKSVAQTMAYDAVKVGNLLKSGYQLGKNALASALKGAGYFVGEVTHAIGSAFNLAWTDVANVLKAAGFNLDEIARGIREVFGKSAKDLAKFFKDVWHIADSVANAALNAAGYAVKEIEDAMKSVYNWVMHAAQTVGDALNPKHW